MTAAQTRCARCGQPLCECRDADWQGAAPAVPALAHAGFPLPVALFLSALLVPLFRESRFDHAEGHSL